MQNITMEEKAITALKNQLKSLKNISSLDDWNNWRQSTLVFVVRIYGEKTANHFQFYGISVWPGSRVPSTKPNIPKAINEAKTLIESFIQEIELFGLQQKNKQVDKSINVLNTNIITQTQNIEIIKDELPPKAMREIQEIAKSEESKESKLQKVGDVLKNIGIDVVSPILAQIIGHAMGIF